MEIRENRFARFSCRFICWKRLYLNGYSSKHLNVTSLKRREFKLCIGGLNNNIPYTVQKLSAILQSAWSWQTRAFNMALNAEARATEQMTISLLIYMNYEPNLRKKTRVGKHQ